MNVFWVSGQVGLRELGSVRKEQEKRGIHISTYRLIVSLRSGDGSAQ